MSLESLDDVYNYNDAMRKKLIAAVVNMPVEQAETRPAPDRWSVAEILEHVSMVETGIGRICQKLLGKSKEADMMSDGFQLSPEFISGSARLDAIKVEAPERVKPGGGVAVADSLALLERSRSVLLEMREDFEKYDSHTHKFPHPYIGDMSAVEWLILAGGHESRHLKQIQTQINQYNMR